MPAPESSPDRDPYENYQYVRLPGDILFKKFPDIEDGRHTITAKPAVEVIAESPSFEDLGKAIDAIGEIVGSEDATYTPQELRERIAQYRSGAVTEVAITRTYGLRDKVVELAHGDTAQ